MSSPISNEGPVPAWLRRRRGHHLLALVGVVLLLVGAFALVSRVAGFADTLDVLREISPIWLLLCLASQVVFYLAYAIVLRRVAQVDGGITLPFRATTRVVFAALGATRLLATGGAGGLALLYWVLNRAGLTRRDAVVRVLGLNTLLYAWFGALTWLAAVLLVFGLGGEAPVSMTAPWIIVITGFVIAGVWVSEPARAGRLADPASTGRLRSAFATAVAGVALVRRLAGSPRANWASLGAGLAYWAADMFCLWVGLRAFGVELSAPTLVLAYSTGFLANMLPLPTGGVGGVDAATTFALHALGVPLAPALLGVFVYRFFSFLLPTIPAILVLPTLPRAARGLREQG